MRHPRRRAALPAALFTIALLVGGCSEGNPAGSNADVGGETSADGSTGSPGPGASGHEDPDAGDESDDRAGEDSAESPAGDAPEDDAPEDDAAGEQEHDDETGGAGTASGMTPNPDVASVMPNTCPEEVLAVGERITEDYEHVEVPPSDELAILTCDWRDSGSTIASVEVSFSQRLFGTDLADVDGAKQVTVGGVDGYVLDSGERKVSTNMFQFHAEGVYITGGSIEVDDVEQGDVLELAEAAIEYITSR